MEAKKNFYYQGRVLTREEAVAELRDTLTNRLHEKLIIGPRSVEEMKDYPRVPDNVVNKENLGPGEDFFYCVEDELAYLFPCSHTKYIVQQLSDILTEELQYIAAHDDWIRIFLFVLDVWSCLEHYKDKYWNFKFSNKGTADTLAFSLLHLNELNKDCVRGSRPPQSWRRCAGSVLTVNSENAREMVRKYFFELYPDVNDSCYSGTDDIIRVPDFDLIIEVDPLLLPLRRPVEYDEFGMEILDPPLRRPV